MSYRIAGTYLEACNCDAICPCRRIDGVPGGRSTHGVCLGALSWRVDEKRHERPGQTGSRLDHVRHVPGVGGLVVERQVDAGMLGVR